MKLSDLAAEFVVPFTFMCGYRSQTTFRSIHTGQDFDTREEAEEAEIRWMYRDIDS